MAKIQSLYKKAVIVVVVIGAFFLQLQYCVADTVSIKSATKVYRMGGYIILINYETCDEWTDGLLFKVHCKFEEEKFTFVSSYLNNVERGWHKTEIAISDVMKKRYGSLRKYEIELYKKGLLVDKMEY